MTGRTVWKYPLMADEHLLVLPRPAEIVHVGAEPGRTFPTVWVEVRPGAPRRPRHLSVRGTGHEVPEGATHLGSAVCGPFVWHVYLREAAP